MGKDRAGNPLNLRLNNDLNPALRPQRQPRLHLHLVLRIEREPEALTNRREQQHDLHHREIVSDTLPWTTAEREVSIFLYLTFRAPPFRPKRVRLVKVARVAMRVPLKRKELRSFRNVITANLRVFERLSADRVRRR